MPSLQHVNLDGTLHPVGGLFTEVVSPGRRVALLVSGLLSSYGRSGSIPAVAAGYEGYLDSRRLLIEARIGARFFWPVGQQGLRLVGGTGITLPVYLDSPNNRLLRYGSGTARPLPGYGSVPALDLAPLSYPHGYFLGKFYSGLPYLEFGARQDRLTLLLDGRFCVAQDYYTPTAVRGGNGLVGYTYSYNAWYVGLTASYSLLRQL